MITRTRRLAMTLGGVALALNTACYAYQPAVRPLVAGAQKVRLHLTPEGTTELARYLGPRVAAADGSLASVAPDGAIALTVEWVQTVDGNRQPWTGEGIVTFPAAYVSGVEESVLSRRQSTLAAIVLTAGVIAIAVAALRSTGAKGASDSGTGSPPP